VPFKTDMRTQVSKFCLKEGAEYCRGLDLVADNRFIGVCADAYFAAYSNPYLCRVCAVLAWERQRDALSRRRAPHSPTPPLFCFHSVRSRRREWTTGFQRFCSTSAATHLRTLIFANTHLYSIYRSQVFLSLTLARHVWHIFVWPPYIIGQSYAIIEIKLLDSQREKSLMSNFFSNIFIRC
jgi:hypothetical protein